MTIVQIYKHWFWITPRSYTFSLILTTHLLLTGLLSRQTAGAGLQQQINVNSYSNSSPVYEEYSTTSVYNNNSNTTNNKLEADMSDTYNGGDTDVYYQYPVKKYSKFSDKKLKGDDKYTKSKTADGYKDIQQVEVSNRSESVFEEVTGTEQSETEANTYYEETTLLPAEANDEPDNKTSTKEERNISKKDVDNTRVTLEPAVHKAIAAATSSDNKSRQHVGAAGAPGGAGLDAGSITGITLGLVVVFGLLGATSFVLYRRKYLNKPQALNDKSSNLDSTGYIDDMSLRDNSEEMYSLDNDSFLNSLEAMTIPNYWTENVKHTKL